MAAEPVKPYHDVDPERALKYAVQHVAGGRAEVVEGTLRASWRSWGHEGAVREIRRRILPRLDRMGWVDGSGNVDLPGSANWYVPDLVVIPQELDATDPFLVLPDQTLLVVECTSPSDEDTDRIVKRKRYAEYGAPLYLLVDSQERVCTVFSAPFELGYTRVDGPHPFGTPVRLPEPFGMDIDTSGF
ncbi:MULTISPECIES: Uma2 family endonuclease [Streptomycetaceae]|uniref:Putative restriction endonuclease domain-containing protein n=1 Tax=Streptantibioticus cattleyicolor (strain ATCC 35852 / DSM 46488 / JCM 4925 / NBRC 14057 / NRRL 8057) TaxID=1003195 RepID=F8K0U4_STREN|nr:MULTISPECIES: Uma2 family endonuclease [Streptomycetaceae]AEW93608.1 hypothetical protein SCATT_12370 [Streptantibioticus cattleyicolor NRRL 8057 = DSM 46488]MYS58312.1 Uma2 family endonuclease [Streptomyces sp. SID5468]CCB73958.1 conserved protein of unknown function [Streptantibioticus cattleyicolor NRRL 8057 = DSM 46488]